MTFKYYNQLKEISDFIHDNPELGYNEMQAAKIQADFLCGLGFEVSFPYPQFPTAFVAEFVPEWADSDSKRVAFFSEYDALKGLGHACGHNLIAVSALSAFLHSVEKIKEKKLNLQVILFGTPAEENFGGKIDLQKLNAFKDIDYGFITHPYYRSGLDSGTLAVSRFDVEFHGKSAHAATAPNEGINALDAMILLFNSIGLYRQQMDKKSMIHGIITNGGQMANIIPELTEAHFYLRTTENEKLAVLEKQFAQMVEAAGLATNCRSVCKNRPNTYLASKKSDKLENLIKNEFKKINWDYSYINEKISSDYANLSQDFPLCNFFFGVCGNGEKIALHTKEFKAAAKSDYAFKQAIMAGQIIANVIEE